MAVAFTAAFGESHSSGTTADTQNGSVSGANTAGLCALVWDDNTKTVSGVVLDPTGSNQALSFIGGVNYNTTYRLELWGIAGPSAVASVAYRATLSGSVNFAIGGASFTGTNQGAGFALTFTHFNSNTATSNAPSLALTTANGSATLSMVSDNKTQSLSAPNFTQIWLANSTFDNGGQYHLSTTTTDTHTWSYGGSIPWGMLGCEIVQAGGDGGGGLFRQTPLTGLGVGGPFLSNPIG